MDAEAARHELVRRLRDLGNLSQDRVADALREVPRERFVPPRLRGRAYDDAPLPIGHGQTISAPHMVALISEALELGPRLRVLEVGTGSGYQAAILGRLVEPGGRVVTVERIRALALRAQEALKTVGATNVEVRHADGSRGWPEDAPFDRIVVTAAAPKIPPPLLEQLGPGGVLVAPVGQEVCELTRLRRTESETVQESLGACAFVPLRGAYGRPRGLFGN